MPPVPFSLLSGVFGAVASCLAKLAFSADTFLVLWTHHACETINTATSTLLSGPLQGRCHLLVILVRALCFVGALALNIFMAGSFLEGMEESGSVAGTALSNAANFGVSSMLGFFLWQEEFSTTWLFGFSLVILGTFLLSTVSAGPSEKDKKMHRD